MATAKSERAQRARRWCSRALLVVGGALAGSAAVWAVSTATATAAPLDSDDYSLTRGAEDVVGAAVDGVEKTLRGDDKDKDKSDSRPAADAKDGTDTTDGESGATENGRDDVGVIAPGIGAEAANRFNGAASQLSALIGGLVGADCAPGRGEAPVGDVGDAGLGDLSTRFEEWFGGELADVVAGLPTDDFGVVGELPPFWPPVTGAPDVTDAVGVEQADAAGHLTGFASDLSRHAASDDDASARAGGDIQNFPSDGIPLRMPAGSPAAPSIPGTGLAGAGNTDGAPLAITHGSGNTLCAAMANKALSGAYVAPVEPGRQPGVTPD